VNRIVKNAAANAVATAVYVGVVGGFISYAGRIKLGQAHPTLIPIAMLMLLVFSAAVTGVLIFGKPALWYLDGRKQEALALLLCTLGIFFALTIVTLVFLLAT
jgi:hypothetical protein